MSYETDGVGYVATVASTGQEAPGGGHLLHWEAMRAFRRTGLNWCDMGGLASTRADDGIYAFKKEFGGALVNLGVEYGRSGAAVRARARGEGAPRMKALVFALLDLLGVNAWFRRRHRGQIKVLLYHNITPAGAHFDFAISPEEFDRHLAHLTRHYNMIGIAQDGSWIGYRADRVNVLLTFDDGFRNNLTVALPILQKHGVSALFFLIADCVPSGRPPSFTRQRMGARADEPPYRTLDVEDAKAMLAAGMAIGSHSVDHSNHAELPPEAALADGTEAQQRLEEMLGVPVGAFAFPWGYHAEGQPEQFLSAYARVFMTDHGFSAPDDRIVPRNEVADFEQMKAAASGSLDGLRRLARRTPRSGYGPPRRPRVAFVLPTLDGGGVERVRLVLMRGFLERGYEVDLVLTEAEGALIGLVPPEVTIFSLHKKRYRHALGGLRRYMRERRPDVCIVSLWPLTSIAVAVRTGLRRPPALILSDHSILSHQYTGRAGKLMRAAIRASYARADALVAVSHGVAKDVSALAHLPTSRIDVIYNPLPTPDHPPTGTPLPAWSGVAGRKRILTVGRLKPVKNHALLIEAFALLLKTTDAELAIVGDGALQAAMERQVRALGIADRVHLPGFEMTPERWYASADLFVLSSNFEGFGNVLVEALGFGLPIVSTDCPGGPDEILDGGRYGTLVPVADAPALAAAMREALGRAHDPEAQRARARDFAVEKAIDTYDALVKRVLA